MLFFRPKRVPFWNPVPFLKAAATACGRRVLRDEGRVMAHGCLFAVIGGMGLGQPLLYKVGGVFEDDFEPSAVKVFKLLPTQSKPPAKRRGFEGCKEFI